MILIGASGHAKVIIDILEKSGIEVNFLVDANTGIQNLLGYRVIPENELKVEKEHEFILSIGANEIRKRIAEEKKLNYGWAIHPSTILADDVTIDFGTVTMAGSIINSSTSIGKHCIINTGATVDHDCVLEDYVHISPNTTLCGSVKVGEGAHVGAGATIIPNISIGKWVTIGAGSVIISDVPDHAVVVGNPGRVIKYKHG